MGRHFRQHEDRPAGPPMGGPGAAGSRASAVLLLLAATVSCSPVNPDPQTSLTASSVFLPVTAQISQFRDNYSRQIIEIQLTNNTHAPLSVLAAELESPLFGSGIRWQAPDGGTRLPPGQPKSLPAPLPAPACTPGSSAPGSSAPATATDAGQGRPATVFLRLAGPEGQTDRHPVTVPAPDPYDVLIRNNAEMCLAVAAAAVAGFGLEPDLERSADARTAVVRLTITPRRPAAPAAAQSLTIDRIEGTTLLEEGEDIPWPRSVAVIAGGPARQLRLHIRPARCDPHAVAEDKVGTLLPLRVRVGGREGVLKIEAGTLLRGRIHDFVTSACGRQ